MATHAHSTVTCFANLPLNPPDTPLVPPTCPASLAGAVSKEAAKQKCPGLIVLPMRTDRYRAVAGALHATLRTLAPSGAVEKASYDDFYIDITAACQGDEDEDAHGSASGALDGCNLHVASGADASDSRAAAVAALPPPLQRAARFAARVQAKVLEQHKLTVSIGAGRTRLLARLLSPLRCPAGITLLPDDEVEAFMGGQALRSLPRLRPAGGAVIAARLQVRMPPQAL